MIETAYYWHLLSNTPGFGAKSIHYIYEKLNKNKLSIRDLFILSHSKLSTLFPSIGQGKFSKADFKALHFSNNEDQHNTYKKLKSENIQMIALDDEMYPRHVLKTLENDAPALLYCKGHLPLLNTKSISIVGTRTGKDEVFSIASHCAQHLSQQGYNIVSGYAKGVDAAAHTGALEASGTTTAVLSSGIRNYNIKKEIQQQQTETNMLFVSQFMPDDAFTGQKAMIRNKLVCAMSEALVVIASGPEKDETGKNSGTFSAARFAFEMQLPVFVMSPKLFKVPPTGNESIIQNGGIGFSTTGEIIKYLSEQPLQREKTLNKKSNTMPPPSSQMTLF
ncbi:MAG: DNA-processing protein DprA [Bacteroidia bacterium]